VITVNVSSCKLDEELERGAFWHRASSLGERFGAKWIGASVYEAQEGRPIWPYHCHHGVEEWMYVVSGAPILREHDAERPLEPGDLVAFPSGAHGAHTIHGPGRIVIFSVGALGWGEAFVTEYPDSDKIAAAPGVRFRRTDAIDSWPERADPRSRDSELGLPLGGRTWVAAPHDLARGDATAPYHYSWCREEWTLVLDGTPTLRHPDGEDVLNAGELTCFSEGPAGAHQFVNRGEDAARLITFSTPVGRPMSTFYPDDETAVIRVPGYKGFRFRLNDRVDEYWDGEPGAEPC
jgi:uncharacterized cupin superfamily protein